MTHIDVKHNSMIVMRTSMAAIQFSNFNTAAAPLSTNENNNYRISGRCVKLINCNTELNTLVQHQITIIKIESRVKT